MLPIIGTVDPRYHFYSEDVCVFCVDEVSPRAIISDKTTRFLAGEPQVFCSPAGGCHKHFGGMLAGIGRAHVLTPVTATLRMWYSAWHKTLVCSCSCG